MENSNSILIIGIIAGVLTAVSMIPQVFKTIKEKKVQHVSPVMLIILIAGVATWIVYGIIKKDLPIIFTNSLSEIINITMLFLRWKFKDNK